MKKINEIIKDELNIFQIILSELKNIPEYKTLTKWAEKNEFESYYLMGELLNPSNAYKYQKIGKGRFTFKAKNDVLYFVNLVYQPTKDPHFEFKLGWIDEKNTPHYEKSDNLNYIDSIRSDTIAKIWKDEILPFFKKQNLSDKIIIKPLNQDIKRYLFALKLVQKFKKKWFDIQEEKPKQITIIKH